MATDGLTDLQLAVMKALWQLQAGTVSEVAAAMSDAGRELAPTTVATLLQRLAKQGWVARRKRGSSLVYRPLVDQKRAAQGVLQRVLSSFFGGSASALTAQLLETEQLNREDIAALRKLLAKKGE